MDIYHTTIDRTPYTYLIGWTKLNKWYYGVRYAKNCHPSELWNSYKTSSKHVIDIYNKHGNPDIIEIRKIFDNIEKARLWENKVLKKMNVINEQKWLNQTNNISISLECSTKNSKKPKDFGSKISKLLTGKKKSDETKLKMSNSRKGFKVSEQTKEKIKKTVQNNWNLLTGEEKKKKFGKFGESNPFYGKKHSEQTKKLISEKKKKSDVNI
jgi:hypothetical protein